MPLLDTIGQKRDQPIAGVTEVGRRASQARRAEV